MKKIISLIIITLLLATLVLTGYSYAASLDTLTVDVDKTTVRPGEEVKVTINFGTDLGAYTFDIKYDNNIFDYVSTDGGTANDTSDKVRVTFYDATGGTAPRTNMSITFKAKADITTSNPTEFTVTAEGLANADASVTYDDITTPIVKNVVVEPEYQDYVISLQHTGEIVKGEEKEMVLSYSSSMGRYYEHARLIAEATVPSGATVKLMSTDATTRAEVDIIQSGWGDPQGYSIGGRDVSQVLNVRALFSDNGNYTITLKLIDRDNSDSVIAEKAFQFTVAETTTTVPPTTEQATPEVPSTESTETTEQIKQETIKELPKTGINVYTPMFIALVSLISMGLHFNKKENNK